MYAALEFEQALARGADVEVTLVNRDNYFLFTPMLHEVAASDLDIANIVSPVRKLLRRVTFFHGQIESIDLVHKRVGLSHGHEEHCHSLPYDHLVLALGSTTNFYNLPGLEERALTMKSLHDAIILRNRLIANLEEADFECSPTLRDPLLNFVVAGGGFAGVETIFFVRQCTSIPIFGKTCSGSFLSIRVRSSCRNSGRSLGPMHSESLWSET
jgi:NADH dehydrogenase